MLIVAALGASVISLSTSFVLPELIPEPLRVADEEVMAAVSDQWLIVAGALAFVTAAAAIAGIVGLYLFKGWARPFNLGLTLMSLFLWPLMGYNLVDGWSQTLYDLGMLTWGAVLALAYFAPAISARFEEKRTTADR